MCGRFNLTDSPMLQALLEELGIDIGPVPVRFNIAPTEPVLTIYQSPGSEHAINQAMDMRWWLTPSWSSGPSQKFAMFNARAETIATARSYRGPFKRQRAIVPASAFIEWQRHGSGKQAYQIGAEDQVLALAAIWDRWEGNGEVVCSCSIVTCAAVPGFERIHSRQPVILQGDEIRLWLDAETDSDTLHALMQPHLPFALQATAIDNSVGNARNKSPTQVLDSTPPIDIIADQ